jgi:hypothetical protein
VRDCRAVRIEQRHPLPARIRKRQYLAAIALVCVEALTGMMCPLTTLEDSLRRRAGDAQYPGEFVGYWAHRLIFYDFALSTFTAMYLIFALLVVLTFLLVPPMCDAKKTSVAINESSQ